MLIVIGSEEMAKKMFLESLPFGTKRVQVKGYHICKEGRYLFCVCMDDQGRILSRTEGSGTASYADVFIRDIAVITSLTKFD